MLRGPLYRKDYRPQFSGHETFPLRYGWLKKAFDEVLKTEASEKNNTVFSGDDAIARFGVGKNMVASMRHWATATGVIRDAEGKGRTEATQLGRRLFGHDGLDPYMENPATAWLLHWQLSGRPDNKKTTWFWALNHYPGITFERETLVKAIENVVKECGWTRASHATIKNDVACFVRTYATQLSSAQSTHEDALESPLTELGLIKPIARRDGFRFARGAKSSLGPGVFCYAVTDFWSQFSTAQTLSFEALAYEPGSPGRVFQLEENDVADLLFKLEDVSDGFYRWSETAGLKQLIRGRELTVDEAISFIEADYGSIAAKKSRNGLG